MRIIKEIIIVVVLISFCLGMSGCNWASISKGIKLTLMTAEMTMNSACSMVEEICPGNMSSSECINMRKVCMGGVIAVTEVKMVNDFYGRVLMYKEAMEKIESGTGIFESN